MAVGFAGLGATMSAYNPLQYAPIKNYNPPNLPTIEEARDTQMPMPLPSRWKKGAVVLACIGVMGVMAYYEDILSRWPVVPASYSSVIHYCPVSQPEEYALAQINAGIEAADLDVRVHFGGASGIPYYVAYITEQDALAFIQARLELAGLNFDSVLPDYMVDIWPNPVSLALFDEERRVGVADAVWIEHGHMWSGWHHARRVTEMFEEQVGDITVGAFFNPGGHIPSSRLNRIPFRRSRTRRADHMRAYRLREQGRPRIIEELNAQIDAFIALLQEEGKL